MSDAWNRRVFIDELKENGYISHLLVDKGYTFDHYNDIRERTDNIRIAEVALASINYDKISETTLNLSFGRLMPYISKGFFLLVIPSSFSNSFVTWNIENNYDMLPLNIGDDADIKLFNSLRTIGLSKPHTDNVFTFTHMSSAHAGGYFYNNETDNLEMKSERVLPLFDSRVISAHASFVILNEYFNQMKQLGIYDDSTIIITADHGIRESAMSTGTLNKEVTSALLIKPANSYDDLKIDSFSELSHKNFGASILEFAGLPHEDFGVSYFDVINSGGTQVREWWYDSISVDNVMGGRFVIEGDANDFDNWIFVPHN
jgi:hypothetical protein